MHIVSTLVAFMAFFGLGFTAPNFDNQTQPQDNPFLTCYTNPCVQVDGVGKIMGSTKVNTYKFVKIIIGMLKLSLVKVRIEWLCFWRGSMTYLHFDWSNNRQLTIDKQPCYQAKTQKM